MSLLIYSALYPDLHSSRLPGLFPSSTYWFLCCKGLYLYLFLLQAIGDFFCGCGWVGGGYIMVLFFCLAWFIVPSIPAGCWCWHVTVELGIGVWVRVVGIHICSCLAPFCAFTLHFSLRLSGPSLRFWLAACSSLFLVVSLLVWFLK